MYFCAGKTAAANEKNLDKVRELAYTNFRKN